MNRAQLSYSYGMEYADTEVNFSTDQASQN